MNCPKCKEGILQLEGTSYVDIDQAMPMNKGRDAYFEFNGVNVEVEWDDVASCYSCNTRYTPLEILKTQGAK